jgi:NHLM bacteriocin system ABC transporter ATP-binding protein
MSSQAIAALETKPTQAGPVLIHDPESVWVIQFGTADLFYVPLSNGSPAGPRRHVLRAHAGQAVFGFPAEAVEGMTSGLLLVPSPDAQVRQTELKYLKDPNPDGGIRATGEALLSGWIEAISQAVAPEMPPQAYSRAEPGAVVRLGVGKNALCLRGLVWVRHTKGTSRFLGQAGAVPIMGDTFFPLVPRTWLTAAQPTVLECRDTAGFHAVDPAWKSVENFHRIVLSLIALQQIQSDEKAQERLKARKAAGAKQMRGALSRLAEPLLGSTAGSTAETAAGDDEVHPLLAACKVVGAYAGIELRAPARAASLAASRDPLRDISRASGVRYRQVLLRGAWWKDDHGPLVGSLQQANPQEKRKALALIPRKGGGYWIVDAADGSRRRVTAESALELSPAAYTFYRPFPNRTITAWDLLTFGMRGSERELTAIFLTGMAGGLLALVVPFFTGMLFNTVIPGAQHSQLMQITALLFVAALVSGMFEMTRSLTLLRVEGRMGATLQAAVWDRLISMPAGFFRQFSAGDLADRANGIDGIRSRITGTVSSSVVSGIFSFFNLALMMYYSWKLTLVALGLLAIAVVATMFVGVVRVRRFRVVNAITGRLSGQVLQFIGGIAKFRVSGTEDRAFAAWSKDYSRQKTAQTGTRSAANHFAVFQSFFFVMGPMVLFYAIDSWQGRIQPGSFLGFNSAYGQLFGAVMQLANAVIQVMSLVPVFERALPILEGRPEVDAGKADPGELNGAIEVSHATFRYRADGPAVLKDVSLRIEAGQFVALVGPSGCGKSTLFRVLLGFETPETGAVLYDGQDLKSVDASLVRRQMGVVLQNGTLFQGDIFGNIVGSAPLTLADAWEAARMSGLDQDIRNMPMGMNTMVSDGGGGLSGGQRQRLMIARAIVNKPRILLFDEATSALDNQTQSTVNRSMEELKSTRIVIAHRLSTVVNADRIFVFDGGAVVESGTYAELIERGGLFAELAQRQLT